MGGSVSPSILGLKTCFSALEPMAGVDGHQPAIIDITSIGDLDPSQTFMIRASKSIARQRRSIHASPEFP